VKGDLNMKKLSIILLSMILITACGGTDDDDVNAQAEEINTEANTFLANGNYEDAVDAYLEILDLEDNDYTEIATIGIGFCDMKLGNAASANTRLRDALVTYPDNIDAKALLSMINYGLGTNSNTTPYSDAVTFGNQVISSNAAFASSYDSSINHNDIRLHLALAEFRLGNLVSSYNHVSSISNITPGFDTNSDDFETALQILLSNLSTGI
jgi:tetratricopeptide (TPR) repeat protein